MSDWWGDFAIAVGKTLRWEIGPRTLWISRGERELRVVSCESTDSSENRLVVGEPDVEPRADAGEVRRYSTRDGDVGLRLRPSLPDRPLVVKPTAPFYVPPAEETTLYVSTPLWLRVHIGEHEILDEAIQRPSDTWFGPDTITGELCYATAMSARLHSENLPLRPGRAVSAVRIKNGASTPLRLEKLKVPVRNLSLYASQEGHLWTEALTLVRDDNTEAASVRLDDRPRQADRQPIALPREPISRGRLLAAFGRLFE